MEEPNKKSYYPHAIIVGIILVIIACVATVIVALDNPVEMDDYYLEKYQKVDHDINEIEAMQKEFFKNYDVKFDLNEVVLSKTTNRFTMRTPINIGLNIHDKKADKDVQNAEVLLVITRPDTSKFNQDFNATTAKNGLFEFKNIKLDKPGRWQLKTKMKIGKLEGFYKDEINATE